MYAQHEKSKANKSRAVANSIDQRKTSVMQDYGFVDNRLEVTLQRKVQAMVDNYAVSQPIQKKENKNGLPNKLKTGFENLSGLSIDQVKSHYNSSEPVQLHSNAFTQGSDIHVANEQEKHSEAQAQENKFGVAITPQSKKKHTTKNSDVPIQRVNAYRVEYSYNRKVITSESGGVTGLTAPIDISFVLPDHSEYFASERSQEQLKGLRVVTWEMNDDWWAAVRKLHNLGKDKLSGKAKSHYNKMQKKLPKPTWSDGSSLTRFIKQTALHFHDKWQDSLSGAIKKGTGAVTDLELEYYQEKMKSIEDTDLVWAYPEATAEDREEADFDESDFGPKAGHEMSIEKANSINFKFMHLGYAESMGYTK